MKNDDLIRALGEQLGIANLALDERGGLGLYLPGGLEIGLRASSEGRSLTAYSILRLLPDADRHAGALLRASLMGEHTGGACLSIGLDAQGRDCLVLWRRLGPGLSDVSELADELARFVKAAQSWRTEPLPGDAESTPVPTESAPTTAAMFTLRA